MKYPHGMPAKPEHVAALDQILELALLVAADMSSGLAERGLTDARAHLLWVLGQQGPCTQRELAESLRVSPRNVTGLVDALVATGFVTREPHPSDRRATLVRFTDHGAKVAAELATDHQEFARLLFEDLPTARFDAFAEGLGAVLDRLRTLVTAAEGERTRG